MNGALYDEAPVSAGGRTSLDAVNLSPISTAVSISATSATISASLASGPLHIPAKRLTVGSYSHPHHTHPHAVEASAIDVSSGGSGSILRHHTASQPWSYADSHAAASVPPSAFDPQYSPSLVRDGMAAAAAAYYGADRAKALSFWPTDYGKYGAAAAAAAAGPSALQTSAEASVQFNAQAWCGYAGYGTRVPEPHGHGLGPAPGQPMGVPVSVAGYLAAEAHEVTRRGAMDAAAAAACFPHDSYAGLRGYAPPDGMPPSVYGPGKSFCLLCMPVFYLHIIISDD